MGFIAAALIYAFTWLYNRSTRKDPSRYHVVPTSFANFPTATEGKPIPVIFGKVKLTPNIVWYGHTSEVAIEQGGQIVGYKHYAGLHYVLCLGPIENLEPVRVFLDDIDTTDFDTQQYNPPYTRRVTILAPSLYGSDGGVSNGFDGVFDIYFGSATQPSDPYLEANVQPGGSLLPAYKNVAHAVLHGSLSTTAAYVGNDTYLRPVTFEVSRYPLMAGSNFQRRVGDDANPANIIYEILTDPLWGCGVAPALVDLASFQRAREWLYNVAFYADAMGMSFILDQSVPAMDVIMDVLRHIDASLVIDPFTGLYRLILVRTSAGGVAGTDFDFPVSTAPVFNDQNTQNIEITNGSEHDIANVIRVHYTSRASNYGVRTAQLQDLASIETAGGQRIVEDIDLLGFTTAENAQKAAARELRQRAYPLRRARVKVNRLGFAPVGTFNPWRPLPGAPFWVDHPYATITLFRVASVDAGTLTDGMVTIEGVEDAFNINWIGSGAPPDSDWIDPNSLPGDTAFRWIEEQPLNMAYQDDESGLLCFGTRGAGGTVTGMRLLSNFGDIYPGVIVEAPGSQLIGNIGYTNTSITLFPANQLLLNMVGSIPNEEFRIGQRIALIVGAGDPNPLAGSEFIAFNLVSYDPGQNQITLSNVVRGCVDTTPKPHTNGSRLWVFSAPIYPALPLIAPDVYFSRTASLVFRLQPFGPGGDAPFNLLTSISHTNNSRALRMWLPTNIRLEGSLYPATYTGNLSITWEHRNRFENSYYNDANRSPTQTREPGMVYRLRFYLNGSGTPARTVDDLTGTSHTYTLAEQTADNGGIAPTTVRVVMDSHQSGSLTLLTWATFDHTMTRV